MQIARLCMVLTFSVGLVGCLGQIGGGDGSYDTGSGVGVGSSGAGASTGQGGAGEGGAGQGGSGQGGSGQGGSGGDSASSSSAVTSGSSGGNADVAQLCVDTINKHRASLGLPPYERWSDAEVCSDGEAQSDSVSGKPHGAFGQCSEFAQNECPGWPGAPAGIIGPCLQAMWDEGPGDDFNKHGHYINMSSTSYTKVACGFWTTPQGSVWAVQNFR